MAKKKRYRGCYCKVCGKIKANEKFSGKGHRNHICKKCSSKPMEQRNEEIVVNKIHGLSSYYNLSKNNRKMLNKYLKDKRENVRNAAAKILELFSKPHIYDYTESMEIQLDNDFDDYKIHVYDSLEEDDFDYDEDDEEDLPF